MKFAETGDARVVLLVSSDESLRRQALRQILDNLGLADGDLDLEEIHGDSKHPSEWVASVSTIPFLGDFRGVVVRSAGRAKPTALWTDAKITASHPLVSLLQSVPETGRLILVGDEDGGSADAQSKRAGGLAEWERLIPLAGGKVVKLDPDPAKTAEAVQAAFQEQGKKASKPACAKLSEMVGGRLGLALDEVVKVCLYVGGQVDVREADIEAVVIPETDYNVFKLAEAVTAGDAKAAITQLDLLAARHPRLADEVFPRVFPMFSRHFRLLWQARVCVEERCSPKSPTPRASASFMNKPNFANEKDWAVERHLRTARKLSLPKIQACLDELAQTDAKFKGALASQSPREALEAMLLQMCSFCR